MTNWTIFRSGNCSPFWHTLSLLQTRLCDESQGCAGLQGAPICPAQTKQQGQSALATLLQDESAVVPLLLVLLMLLLTELWQGGTELSQEQAPRVSGGADRSKIRTTPAYLGVKFYQPNAIVTEWKGYTFLHAFFMRNDVAFLIAITFSWLKNWYQNETLSQARPCCLFLTKIMSFIHEYMLSNLLGLIETHVLFLSHKTFLFIHFFCRFFCYGPLRLHSFCTIMFSFVWRSSTPSLSSSSLTFCGSEYLLVEKMIHLFTQTDLDSE